MREETYQRRPLVGPGLARMIGVNREASDDIVAEYLLRQANRHISADQIPIGVARWIVGIGASLAAWYNHIQFDGADLDDVAQQTAEESVRELRRADAPTALLVIAPHQVVNECRAADLQRVCRALVARHLTGFCRSILRTWEVDGHISPREPDELMP